MDKNIFAFGVLLSAFLIMVICAISITNDKIHEWPLEKIQACHEKGGAYLHLPTSQACLKNIEIP